MKTLLGLCTIVLLGGGIYLGKDKIGLEESHYTQTSIICDDRIIALDLEYARDARSRAQGLMYRTHLGAYSGMLFVFPDEQMRSFWMKNTLIGLDIIFIDSHKKIIHIHPDAKVQDTSPIPSHLPAHYVLEVNAGRSHTHRISTGCILSF